jgi:hypothetical protein
MEELTEADLVDLSPGLGRQVIEVVDTMMSRLEGLKAALGGAKPQGRMDMGWRSGEWTAEGLRNA